MTDLNTKGITQLSVKEGGINRAFDTEITSKDEAPIIITLEKINQTLLEYFQDIIKPTVIENEIQRSVPVIYGSSERWASVRQNGALRDIDSGKLQTPLIMIRRSNIKRGIIKNPLNKYHYVTLDAGWNPRNTYDKFAVQNRVNPSKQLKHVMIPDYMIISYDVVMWTEYQEQMDKLIEQISTESHDYWGTRNAFKFMVSIEEYPNDSDLPATSERLVRTRFNMVVNAYILPDRIVNKFKISSSNSKVYTTKKIVTIVEVDEPQQNER